MTSVVPEDRLSDESDSAARTAISPKPVGPAPVGPALVSPAPVVPEPGAARAAGSPEPVADGATAAPVSRTHREIIRAMSGLMLGMFVTLLSSTVVSTSLPVIVADLGGGQSAFTWVVTATLLATTVSTPIWGKLADLTSRTLLVQLALGIFVLGSALAGLSTSPGMLISFRVMQGLGAGGMTALVVIVMADLISPRERGRYMGLLGGVTGVAMVAGPLLGGVVTDAFGWRWNFFIGVPIAVVAAVVLQRTLHLPVRRSKVRIDYLGAGLIAAGVSALLIWVTLAGGSFDWMSWQSAVFVVGSIVVLVAAVFVERSAASPVIPMHLFGMRTAVLSIIASAVVGIALFGSTVFLGEFLQLSRGKTPTEAGLLTIPMVVGLFLSSLVIGRIISATGRYKRWMVIGAVLSLVGFALLATMTSHSPLLLMGIYLFVLGAGTGMVMQNLVLIVQNEIAASEMGAASAAVAFFRTLGGAIGVSALGAVLGSRVGSLTAEGIASKNVPPAQLSVLSDGLPEPAVVRGLPDPIRSVLQDAFAGGVAEVFMITAGLSIITVITMLLLRERPLGTRNAVELLAESKSTS
ncbi:MDR family MFS transporter [Nakamurella lactea]|uniref:MDR family MFS transporter n=1 Tax=Nakamurella lactea TaxID=459515 RepID=UPI000428EFD3|nr:MDR family MFS transporter [Nakamurella lactea]